VNEWLQRKRKLFMAIGFVFASVVIGTLFDSRLFIEQTTRWLVSYQPTSVEQHYMIQNAIEGGCVIAGLIWGYVLYRPEIKYHQKEARK
jgi:hypothetical protein